MPGARQRLQARREDVARDAEVALELGEAADAEERLADDQERPALAEHLHRAADRTGLVLHHVTVSRWRSRSSTDTTTCCSRRARSPSARARATSISSARARARFAGGFFAIFTRAPGRLPARRRARPGHAARARRVARAGTRDDADRGSTKLLALEDAGRAARRARARRPRPELGGPVQGGHAHRGRRGDRGRARGAAGAARARPALARHHVEPAERVRARRAVRGARPPPTSARGSRTPAARSCGRATRSGSSSTSPTSTSAGSGTPRRSPTGRSSPRTPAPTRSCPRPATSPTRNSTRSGASGGVVGVCFHHEDVGPRRTDIARQVEYIARAHRAAARRARLGLRRLRAAPRDRRRRRPPGHASTTSRALGWSDDDSASSRSELRCACCAARCRRAREDQQVATRSSSVSASPSTTRAARRARISARAARTARPRPASSAPSRKPHAAHPITVAKTAR